MKAFGRTFVFAAAILGAATAGTAEAASSFADRAKGIRPIQQGAGGGGEREVPIGFYREEKFIRHMYRGFLGRDPGADEVAGWRRQVDQGASANDLVAAFIRSDEFFVRQLYLGLLRRDPDPSGMNSFVEALRRGKSRAEVLDTILRSAEFQQTMK